MLGAAHLRHLAHLELAGRRLLLPAQHRVKNLLETFPEPVKKKDLVSLLNLQK